MDKNCGKISISDYSFLRLLASSIILKKQSQLIINHELEKDLYGFYDRAEYHFLFEDICKRTDPTGENNYVDLNCAFQQAYAFGLILQIQDCQREIKSIINFSEDEATQIQSQYSKEQSEAMSHMCDEMFELKKDKKADERKQKFDVSVVPCSRPFVVSREKEEQFVKQSNSKEDNEFVSNIAEDLINEGPVLKKIRRPDKK